MAIYRQIHTTYWADDYIGDLEPTEKLFYLYLLTNEKTTQCGVYQFSTRYAKFELGLTGDQVDQLLKKFGNDHKIVFNSDNNEIYIRNWLKYNSARSPKVAKVIDKELFEVKTREFESEVIRACEKYGYPITTKSPKENSVSIGYGYGIDTISQPEPEPEPEPEPSHHQQKAREDRAQPETPAADVSEKDWQSVQQTYEGNFGQASPLVMEDLEKWLHDLNPELVIEAMRRAVTDQKGYRYAVGIMKNWVSRNIDTMVKVKAEDVRHESNKQRGSGQKMKPQEQLASFSNDDLPF